MAEKNGGHFLPFMFLIKKKKKKILIPSEDIVSFVIGEE